MEERVKTELKGKKPSEMQDLLLDNCKATTISGLTEEFTSLTTLSLINIGLTSLDGLPKLPTLRTIDLSDNKLGTQADLEKLVECCPRLYHINLCANKITELDTLAPLKKLDELAALDLFDCSVTETVDYRTKIFALIPHLKYLDGFDVNDVEAEISDDEDGVEDAIGDEDDSAEDEVDSEDEEALAYLNSSKALQDEDESEDYIEKNNVQQAAVVTNGGEKKDNGEVKNGEDKPTGENNRKRKHDGDEAEVVEGEPEAKQ